MKGVGKLIAVLAAVVFSHAAVAGNTQEDRVNILLITVDDMNWNSVGAFGNPIRDITPHIDRLANEGRRYDRAYVAASNCSPSRVALQTGLYPQQSGATGFFYIDGQDTPTIATELRRNGFFAGVINKIADTNPSPENSRYWDYRANMDGTEKYSAPSYGAKSAAFLAQATAHGQPFYLVVNIADPHKPNFNDPQARAMGADAYLPSRIIAEAEVSIPAFLPDLPKVLQDVRNYYNSVKRADDAVGEIMAALRESGLEDDTLVVFLSDHGMPFPFAKSSVYDNGLRTPLIMKLPGSVAPGSVESAIVSSVDLMPTILGIAGVEMPHGKDYFGQALLGPAPLAERHYAFGNFDANAKGYPVPMRGVVSRDWNYVFNAWADGEHAIRVADMSHASYKQMERHARTDPAIRARLEVFNQRATEELCHLQVDPDCLVNLAGDPAYHQVLVQMQSALRSQMVRTGDYLLAAFEVRDDPERLRVFMRRQHELAEESAARLQWKRDSNIAGNTRANGELYEQDME